MLDQTYKEQLLQSLKSHSEANPLGLYPHQLEAVDAIINFLGNAKMT
jgi:hypothetical protein